VIGFVEALPVLSFIVNILPGLSIDLGRVMFFAVVVSTARNPAVDGTCDILSFYAEEHLKVKKVTYHKQ
jgi:hypothetical protein